MSCYKLLWGVEALAIASIQPIALIATTQQLPDMDGFTLIERLRAAPGADDLPAIVIGDNPDSERARDLGIAGISRHCRSTSVAWSMSWIRRCASAGAR